MKKRRKKRKSGVRSAQRRRFFAAWAIIAALVCISCLIDVCLSSAEVSAASKVVGVVNDSTTESWEASPPEWFLQELFSLDGYTDFMVFDEGAIVGFSATEASEQVFTILKDEMTNKGWSFSDGGVAACGTFTKQKGKCRWAWVSCSDISGSTSVVVQCVCNQ
jgi:hypothetical protein